MPDVQRGVAFVRLQGGRSARNPETKFDEEDTEALSFSELFNRNIPKSTTPSILQCSSGACRKPFCFFDRSDLIRLGVGVEEEKDEGCEV